MKARQKLLLLTVVLAAFLLACGLGSTATDKINEAVDSAATQVIEQVATTVATALPDSGTVVAAVEDAATKVAEEAPATAATDTPEAMDNTSDGTADGGDTEVAPLDISNADSALAQLSSYRAETSITIDGVDQDGNPIKGSMTTLQEATKDPDVSHASMSATGDVAKETGGTEGVVIEWYTADGNMYMFDPSSSEWSMLPGDNSMFGDMLFSATDVVDIPKSAKRSLLPVDVNGISTWHYTFDASDFPPDPSMEIKDGHGEAWIARDGNYPVKMQFEITAKTLDPSSTDAQLFSEGKMIVSYELKDVNKNFEIVIPEEALNAASMFGGDTGGSGDTGSDGSGGTVDLSQVPMMDGAEVQFSMAGMTSYNVTADPADVIDFYRTQLADLGWSNNPDVDFTDETGGFLEFTKDGTTLTVIVDNSAGDGTTSVSLLGE